MDKCEVDYSKFSYKTYLNGQKVGGEIKQDKKNRVLDKGFAISALIIFLCFTVTLFATDFLSGKGLLTEAFGGGRQEITSYYAVAMDSSDDSGLITFDAEELRLLGGAGFLYKDKKYYLIAAVYEGYAEAEKVLKGISTPSSCIYQIDIATPSLSWCDKEKKEGVNATLSYYKVVYDSLYSVSTRLDKGEITEYQAVTELTALSEKLKLVIAEFEKLNLPSAIDPVLKLRVELLSCFAMVESLAASGLSGYGLLSDMRYTYTLTLLNFKSLAAEI